MKKLLLYFSFITLSTTIYAQWSEQATGFNNVSRGLSEIRAVNSNVVWAVAYDGSPAGDAVQEFTRTTDGGNTWTAGFFNVNDPALSISNISPVSGTTAWVGAYDESIGLGGVFKTTNGGETWQEQNAPAYNNAASWFNCVHFFDANVGITMGDPIGSGLGEFEIYRTTDGGTTWSAPSAATLPNPLSGEYGYNGGYVAFGDTMWFTTNKGYLYRTTDKGVTWNKYLTPASDFGGTSTTGSGASLTKTFATVDFSSATNGCLLKTVTVGDPTVTSTTRTLYTTSDGGQTWSAGIPFTGTRFILNYIPGTTTIVATSQAAPVGTSVSTDNGTTWTEVESGDQRGAAAFVNSTTGWCAGFNEDPFTGGIFKLTGSLGTEDLNTTKFKVYPNPATSIVNLQTEGLDAYKLKVTDLSGKVMTTREFNGMENTIDISSYAAGVYFFEINSGNTSETIKIIKN